MRKCKRGRKNIKWREKKDIKHVRTWLSGKEGMWDDLKGVGTSGHLHVCRCGEAELVMPTDVSAV